MADYTYVSKHWENCNVFVVPLSHPAKNVQEFIAWAKTRTQGITYGSAGIGTTRRAGMASGRRVTCSLMVFHRWSGTPQLTPPPPGVAWPC